MAKPAPSCSGMNFSTTRRRLANTSGGTSRNEGNTGYSLGFSASMCFQSLGCKGAVPLGEAGRPAIHRHRRGGGGGGGGGGWGGPAAEAAHHFHLNPGGLPGLDQRFDQVVDTLVAQIVLVEQNDERTYGHARLMNRAPAGGRDR